MSLSRTADRLAQKMLRIFDSFRKSVSYEAFTGVDTYDVETDATVRGKTTYTPRVLFVKPEETETEASFSATATYTAGALVGEKANALIARLDMNDSFDPSTGDVMTETVGGKVWRVTRQKNPPGASIFKLEVVRVA